jgi:hypothetical protein
VKHNSDSNNRYTALTSFSDSSNSSEKMITDDFFQGRKGALRLCPTFYRIFKAGPILRSARKKKLLSPATQVPTAAIS